MEDTESSLSKSKLNQLRAAVLGANDGIVSVSSVVMGVAGAGANQHGIFAAGMAALVAGALSMAVGEYVSVSSQSDAEKMHNEKVHGDAHAHEVTNPWHAAWASLLAFSVGGLVPFLAIIITSHEISIVVTVIASVLALFVTGYMSATVGGASRRRAMVRVIIGGLLAMLITYLAGKAFGAIVS